MIDKPHKYKNKISTRLDKSLGYLYFMDKDHPLSSKTGRVWHHRHIASLKKGEWLNESEVVHHVDGVRCNNNPSNLEILSAKTHTKLHFTKHGKFSKSKGVCAQCGKKFDKTKYQKYCSVKCSGVSSRKIEGIVDVDWLRHHVWQKPSSQIAKELGCSDVALGKFCKKHNIKKPPRGYWKKFT